MPVKTFHHGAENSTFFLSYKDDPHVTNLPEQEKLSLRKTISVERPEPRTEAKITVCEGYIQQVTYVSEVEPNIPHCFTERGSQEKRT